MKYYCIGIKGAGMSTLANILYDLGNEVSGYDDVYDHKFTEEGLEKRGIKIYYDNTHDIPKDTIVTYSVAFSENHKEIKRVKELGLQIKKYNEIIGDITSKFKTISVSGTHGKTTTSKLITHILDNVYGVSYFIGDGTGVANKNSDTFVIESDEFNRHFLAYHPTYTVITNIELEHTEIYRDIQDIIETFETFANENTSDLVIACGDNENIRKINFKKQVMFYGLSDRNDIYAKDLKLDENGASFDVILNGDLYSHFDLPLYGEYMVLNALAAIAVCIKENVSKEDICKNLKTFKNAKRRFAESIVGDNIVIDDYAHHPTEIKVTLEAVRQKYPDKELVVLFKPNTYSRTAKFPSEFASALNIADKAYLTEIDCNREKKEDYPGVTSNIVLEKLKNGEIISEESIDKLLEHKDAVICFMSCASIAHLKESFENLKINKI